MSLDLNACEKRYKQLQLGVFARKNSAFLAPLLCSLKVKFTEGKELGKPEEAFLMGVDGETLHINPNMLLKVNLNDGIFVLEHELWHLARLHHQRQGSRDHHIWNCACDHVINLAMVDDGSHCSLPMLCDEQYRGMSEEDIYTSMVQNNSAPPPPTMSIGAGSGTGQGEGEDEEGNGNAQQEGENGNEGNNPSDNAASGTNGDGSGSPQGNLSDLMAASKSQIGNNLANVAKAKQQAQMSGASGLEAGSIAGNLVSLWEKFLAPKLPWESILHNLMKDLVPKSQLSWKRRNRRFMDIHLPSMVPSPKRLGHLVYAIDTSGSVDEDQLARINSEIKYIHDHVKPKKLTVIQFDHALQHVDTYTDREPYTKVTLHGGGGTSYVPVKDFVDELPVPPDGLVVFTDLYCTPMEPLEHSEIPVFWVAVNTLKGEDCIPFGEYIPVEV